MSRRAITLAAVGAAALSAGGGSVLAEPFLSRARVASVTVLKCAPATRTAVFHSRMVLVPGAERMSMRFTLLQRQEHRRGAAFERVRAPALSRWRRSRPGVRKFVVKQRVRALRRGAAYRALVQYRWLDARGRVVRRARRRSGVCRQAGPLPNLRLLRVRATEGRTAGTTAYVVAVANTGGSGTAKVAVELSVGGSPLEPQTIAWIPPRQARTVRFEGPACAGPASPVDAVADPDDLLRESSETDNALTARCDAIGA